MTATAAQTAISNARRRGLRGKAPRPVYAGRPCHCGGFEDTRKHTVGLCGTRPVEIRPCTSSRCREVFTAF